METSIICILFVLLDDETMFFQIKANPDSSVFDLKHLILKERSKALSNFDASELLLYQLNDPVPLLPLETLAIRIKDKGDISTFGTLLKDGRTSLPSIFPKYPTYPDLSSLHFFVKRPTLKRHGSQGIDSGKAKIRRIDKKWTVNGAIDEYDIPRYYYVDPKGQQETAHCLTAIREGKFLLLAGSRASGKTTRLLRLRTLLQESGLICLLISFHRIKTEDDVQFWTTFGYALDSAAEAANQKMPKISSLRDFLDAFRSSLWPTKPVILFDEFGKLYSAPDNVRNQLLEGLRDLKTDRQQYGVRSVIAAGTFSILYLNTTDPSVSPFNVADKIQNPNFSMEEVSEVFRQFAQESQIVIEDAVVEDIWEKSSGHPGMVCLCGRSIWDDIEDLTDTDGKTVTYPKWQQYSVSSLTRNIVNYNTFMSMITSLSKPNALDAVFFLRSYFAGYLDGVEVGAANISFANFLTTEGVLSKPFLSKDIYRMSSPLIDGLIRTRVIPMCFPDGPSIPLPYQNSVNSLQVLDVLIESLKFFDKELIRLAPTRSFKSSNVPVMGYPKRHVPRESVYDTELMRILSNWLSHGNGWTVTGQWHLRNEDGRNRYPDIILKDIDNDKPIVLELLATGDRRDVEAHVKKTPEYKTLLPAVEAWVIHFTCETDYQPIWQSAEQLRNGLNVAHFRHNPSFTEVQAWARWTDDTGGEQNFEKLLHMS